MQMRVAQHFKHIPHRRCRNVMLLTQRAHLLACARRSPLGDRRSHLFDPRDPSVKAMQGLVRAEIGAVHRLCQVCPVLIRGAHDCDPSIGGFESVKRNIGIGDVAIAAALRRGIALVCMSGGRKQGRKH
jgi:hypothetical protein